MPQIPQPTTCVYARTPLWRAGSTSGPATSRLHVCSAQPPGPAPGRAAGIPSADLLCDFEGAQARVGTKQKRQGQFQAVAQRAQTGGRQQCLVELPSELKPRGYVGAHAMRQGRTRRYGANIQRAGKEPESVGRLPVGTAIGTQPQNPTPCMLGHAPGRMAQWWVFANESANQEVGAKHTLRGSGLDGRAAGIPSADLLHDFDAAQARVGTKQKRQGQFQAVAQRAQIFGAVGDTTDTYREFVVNARTDSKTFRILPGIARYLPTNASPALEVRWQGSFWIINHVM